MKNRRWLSVDQVHSHRKSIGPICSWDGRLVKKCQACLDNMAMLSFSNPIVFRCMRRRGKMGDAMGREKLTEGYELTTIIRIKVSDGKVKVFLNQRLEHDEGIADLGLLF